MAPETLAGIKAQNRKKNDPELTRNNPEMTQLSPLEPMVTDHGDLGVPEGQTHFAQVKEKQSRERQCTHAATVTAHLTILGRL